jgi:hypothetical protein
MIAWMFETLWHAIFGLLMLIGVFGGAVFMVIKAIVTNTEHNQATCGCWDCKDRRARAVSKQYNQRYKPIPPKVPGEWLPTTQLRRFTKVDVKGIIYQVQSIEVKEGLGYLVFLRSEITRKETMVTIHYANRNKLFWRRADG